MSVLTVNGNTNSLLLAGIAIAGGSLAARGLQTLRVPRIVGYIVVGVVLGPLLGVVSAEAVDLLEPLSWFALGLIGFLIGGELDWDIFKRFGRQVTSILLFEGLTAFALVTLLSFVITLFYFDWRSSLAMSVVLGAICAATDPASTVNVLWEYKARGPVSSMLKAVVALDDALALVLYIASVSIAGFFLSGGPRAGFVSLSFHALYEVAGSLALGLLCAFVLKRLLSWVDDDERILIFTVGAVVAAAGLAYEFGLDIILSSMVFGVALVNLGKGRRLRSFDLVRRFSGPVYVLFFTMIGARLNVSGVGRHVWMLAAAYIGGSVLGKTTGAYWGALYSRAVPAARKYLGFCLYQQGTVAVALLVMASTRFTGDIRETMLSVILLGVLVFQLVGPLFVKMGISRAGEAGLNITEEDLIRSYKVGDIMDSDVAVIRDGQSLSEVIRTVSGTESFYYPVVRDDNILVGAVTLGGMRNTFVTQELNDWLVALDIMEPLSDKVTPVMALSEALEKAAQLDVEYLPVVKSNTGDVFVGVLDCRAVHRTLAAEVLARQQKADIAGVQPV